MSNSSNIEWTDATWNPVRGCVKVSPGCAHCYAETFAERFRGVKGHPYEQGFDLRLVPEKLTEPLRWKKPRRIFVNSMSDLFQAGVPDSYIDQVFAVMALCPQHTFQVLTKRADRMRAYLGHHEDKPKDRRDRIDDASGEFGACHANLDAPGRWPLPNVWLGASVENQPMADRIPLLLQTPAAVRFVSCEPLLGAVDLNLACAKSAALGGPWSYNDLVGTRHPRDGRRIGFAAELLDWVIVGGESGPGARPMDLAWARSIVQQCKAANVPCFVKQLGVRAFDSTVDLNAVNYQTHSVGALNRLVYLRLNSLKGGDPTEWPADLRVREYPGV